MIFRSLAFPLLVAACVPPARAADYYLLADQPGDGSNWNSIEDWFSSPTGGANPTSMAEHRFLTNGKTLRLFDGTFAGPILVMNGGGVGLKTPSFGQTATVATLVSTGGTISQFNGYTQNTLAVGQFINLGTTTLAVLSGRGYTISATTLTGDGNFLVSDAGTVRFQIADASSFRGMIDAGAAASTLEFLSTLVSGGGLVIGSSAKVILQQNVTFAGVTINGAALAPGTYSNATLRATYGSTMFPSGTGSITCTAASAPKTLAWGSAAGGIWNSNTSNLAWTGASGPSPFVQGAAVRFDGTDAAPESRVISVSAADGTLHASTLEFAKTGYALESFAPAPLVLGGASISAAPGKTATIDAPLLLTYSGGFTFTGGGTLNIDGDITRPGLGALHITGGTTVNLTSTLNTVGNSVTVGNTATGDVLNLNGGTVDIAGTTATRLFIVSNVANAKATVNVNSGRILIDRAQAGNRLVFGSSVANSTTTAALNLNGGLVSIPGFAKQGSVVATLKLNGGVVQANSQPPAPFLEGLSAARVSAGGAKFSTGDWLGGYSVQLSQALSHDPALGTAKDGGLIKQDYGTLILSAANSYTGDTVVERGTLRVDQASLDDLAAVKLGANAELNLNFTGTDTVGALFINGQAQPAGTWGGPQSGAAHISSRLAGTGRLSVVATPPSETVSAPTKNPLVIEPLAAIATLPDPLVALDGTPVTSVDYWNKVRRPEILELFRKHVYGRNSVDQPATLAFTEESQTSVFGGTAVLRKIKISFANDAGTALSFYAYAYVPTVRTVKGVFVFINNRSGGHESNPVVNTFFAKDVLVSRGYAAVGFYNADLALDSGTSFDSGIFNIFGPKGWTNRPGDAWGAIGAWAWGASRVIDWVKTDSTLRTLPVAVVGHSRGGKAALWCGAQDTRVQLTVSNSSGAAGAAITRTKSGEHVTDIYTSFPYWFGSNYRFFRGLEATMPFDQHMLIALMAPRRVYIQSSSEDANSDPTAEYEGALRAGPVFDLFGLKPVGGRSLPASNTAVHGGAIGYHMRAGTHDLTPYDWGQFMDYTDRYWTGAVSALSGWRAYHGLDPLGAQDLDAPAGDGVPNLVKFALNLAPAGGGSLRRPATTMPAGGTAGLPVCWIEAGAMKFQHVRLKSTAVPGIVYTPESSTDLVTWTPLAATPQIQSIDDSWERLTYVAPLATPSGRTFLRLRIAAQ